MRLLIEIFAFLLACTATPRAVEVKTPKEPLTAQERTDKKARPVKGHLESWEREVLGNLQLLENLELLQKMDLFTEDFSVFGLED
ncbi:MAG TPA: hypothetical protein VM425_13815 [Myxococcota bacterium]|nr:hypothetical protein [Myxococcota bacterium]